MKEFNALVDVVDHLMGPDGCPWDRVQTMKDIRTDLLEESCELIEAIGMNDAEHIQEELGDLFFVLIFLSRLGEKEKLCTMSDSLKEIREKIIRRHPHVYEEEKVLSADDLHIQWEKIKKTEKGKETRESVLDGIPLGLPALARADKVLKKMNKVQFPGIKKEELVHDFEDEESLGEYLVQIALKAKEKGLHPELALKKYLTSLEEKFRIFEKNTGDCPKA